MVAGGVAFEEVTEDPSSGLVFWQQKSLLLFLNCLFDDIWFPIELQEESRNDVDVADISTANQEQYDIDSSYLII